MDFKKVFMAMGRRQVSLLVMIAFSVVAASAQDVIVKKDGTTIRSQVMEIGDDEVVYKEWGDAQGIVYAVAVDELKEIQMANGDKETFAADDASADDDDQSGFGFEVGIADGGFSVGIDWLIKGFDLGFSWAFGETNDVVTSNSAYEIHLGYNYRYFITPQKNAFIEGRILGGAVNTSMSMKVQSYNERTGRMTTTTKDIDEWNGFLGITPRIGFAITKLKNGTRLALVAGYRWDFAKFKLFNKDYTSDYFTISLIGF